MTFTQHLRKEMHQFLARRHDFALRKLSFCTALLGLGAISTSIEQTQFAVAEILYLVPLIALAFDLHIVAEDHRIKRTGIYLGRRASRVERDARDFEAFVEQTKNPTFPFSFGAVTAIMLGLSAFVLWTTRPYLPLFLSWVVLVLIADVMLMRQAARARQQLARVAVK